VKAFVDTNVFVRHLTGDPADQGAAATQFLAAADELYLTDLVIAEVVYVLESYYKVGRERVAKLVRAVVGFPATVVVDEALILRALEVYELDRLDFAEAYLVACAERSGVRAIATFDRSVDRIASVVRIDPGAAAA
jgi:predicted nucleic acid-binding protein